MNSYRIVKGKGSFLEFSTVEIEITELEKRNQLISNLLCLTVSVSFKYIIRPKQTNYSTMSTLKISITESETLAKCIFKAEIVLIMK